MTNTKKNWTTPKLTPLMPESTDGSVNPGMGDRVMMTGDPKTVIGLIETHATAIMGGVTTYRGVGPS